MKYLAFIIGGIVGDRVATAVVVTKEDLPLRMAAFVLAGLAASTLARS